MRHSGSIRKEMFHFWTTIWGCPPFVMYRYVVFIVNVLRDGGTSFSKWSSKNFSLYIKPIFLKKFPFSISLNFGETVASPVPTHLNVLPLCFCEYFELLRKLEYMHIFLGKTSQDILTRKVSYFPIWFITPLKISKPSSWSFPSSKKFAKVIN